MAALARGCRDGGEAERRMNRVDDAAPRSTVARLILWIDQKDVPHDRFLCHIANKTII